MAKATLQDIPQIFIQNPKILETLRQKLGRLYDQDSKPVKVYSDQIKDFNDKIHSPEINIDPKLSPKELGIKFEEWFEILKQQQTTTTETPEYQEQSTTTGFDLETKVEKLDEREAVIKQTRNKAATDVSNTQARLKEIYDQQKIIQDQIAKAQVVQSKIDGKKVYAVAEFQTPTLTPEAAESLETLIGYATYEETRTELIDQLTEEIKAKTGSDELFARTAAVQVVNDLANPSAARETLVEAAIQEAISNDKDKIVEQVLQKENALIETAKKGATIHEFDLKDSVYLPKEVAEKFFGKEISEAIYGPEQIKVTLSSEKNDKVTHELDLGSSNQNYIKSLQEKNSIIDSAREFGTDKANSVFINNTRSYLAKKAASLPEGSILKKAYSSDAVRGILSNYGLAEKVEWKVYDKGFVSVAAKYFPESTPYFKLFSEVTGVSVGIGTSPKVIPITFGRGAVPLGKIAYIQPVKSLGAPYTLGIKTGSKFAVGKTAAQAATQTGVRAGFGAFLAKGAAALGVSLGVFTAGVSTAITLAVAAVGKMINWPKVKQWFYENREMFAIGAGVGGLMIGGPVAGAAGLGLGLVATGTLGSFAVGAFGVLGFIGRSVGVAIATPVIVTLLVIPPLVAFIMLVINNSAYVVPPSISSLLQNQDNLYVEVSKIAEPAGPFENSDLPLKIKYTITVKARKDILTNISFEHECKVIQENSSKDCIAPTEAPPESISPTSPYVYEYEANYNSSYKDALVTNTFTATADSGENTSQSSSGNATITIGEPPAKCLQIDGAWPNSAKANMESAKGKLVSEFPTFVAKVCAEYPEGLPLKYEGSGYDNYWGWFKGSYILFYPKGVNSTENATYTLAHELVHALVAEGNNFAIYLRYLSTPGILSETPKCFYSYNPALFEERLAETVAFTVINPRCGNPQQQWPKHYNFVQQNIMK